MTATVHKLTAGDGYTYLIRQVAAVDGTDKGRASLSDYYSAKGESPGHWIGSGLKGLAEPVGRDLSDPAVAEIWTVEAGSEVTESQMKALFGEGYHPNADKIRPQAVVAEIETTLAAELDRVGPAEPQVAEDFFRRATTLELRFFDAAYEG